jgi:crotonobetainyl-CoA:carnitine CoA-transferase CaiB-like acyl-CoA transferase
MACHSSLIRDRWWAKVRALGVGHLIDNPKFSTFQARSDNHKELISIFMYFCHKTRMNDADSEEQGCIYTPIQNIPEVAEDPQPWPTAM